MAVSLRPADEADYQAIWEMFRQVVVTEKYFAFLPQTDQQEALNIWVHRPQACYVAEEDGQVLGSYFIKENQPGLGAHVCNAGYMVANEARGKGLATLMCEHSQAEAIRLGFKAMQFNFVISSNDSAVHLWQKLGFDIVGTVPQAHKHPELGLVDVHIMHKFLTDES